jgi:hypothetical protein
MAPAAVFRNWRHLPSDEVGGFQGLKVVLFVPAPKTERLGKAVISSGPRKTGAGIAVAEPSPLLTS